MILFILRKNDYYYPQTFLEECICKIKEKEKKSSFTDNLEGYTSDGYEKEEEKEEEEGFEENPEKFIMTS